MQIPNLALAYDPSQSDIDSNDIAIISAGISNTGVYTGCAATAGGGMVVNVSAGTAGVGSSYITCAGGSVTLVAPTSGSRFSIIYLNLNGTLGVTNGSSTSGDPVFPALVNNTVTLAAVFVATGTTTITNPMIVDKRMIIPTLTEGHPTPANTGSGFLGWNYDPVVAGDSFTPIPGILYLMQIPFPQGGTINNVWMGFQTAATAIAAGSKAAVFNSAGTRIGISSDQASAWVAAGVGSVATACVCSALSPDPQQFIWVGVLFAQGSGNPGTLFRAANSNISMNNLGSMSNIKIGRSVTNGSGLSAIPSSIIPANNGVTNSFWVAIS